mgnify:CR=1 FL=1
MSTSRGIGPDDTPLIDDQSAQISPQTRDRLEEAKRSPSVSIIIPTYNEAQNILTVIDRCLYEVSEYSHEIIVVDDNSPDGTWQLVENSYLSDSPVSVIRRQGKRSLSMAVSRGFRESVSDVCIVMDADLQHPPEKIPDLLVGFDGDVDLVIASRYMDGGGIKNWSLKRRLVSHGATFLVHQLLPSLRGIEDPLSGFFAVRREVLKNVSINPLGYKILLELLLRCEIDGVKEVPYTFCERTNGDSKLSIHEYLNFIRHLVRLRVTTA